MRTKRSQQLKQHLIGFHWHNLVRDNLNIDVTELDKRLKPISYLREKVAHEKPTQKPGRQLTIFGNEKD
jgi:hypothetical protein